MKSALRILLLTVSLSLSLGVGASAWALNPGERVDNFRLVDAAGNSHELYYLSDMKAVVLMVQGNGCPIVRLAMPAYHELMTQYKDKGVEFLLFNSNLQDTREAVAEEAKEYGYQAPILLDSMQLVGESLGVTRTAEVFVIDPKTWKLVYRGPVDDRIAYEAQRPTASRRYTSEAIDAVLAGRSVQDAQVNSMGCLVNMPGVEARPAHAKISYSKTIAPMLRDKCVACHQTGGVAPFAMTSYDIVKGFAPMIREVVRTQRMPPWHADPHYGAFVGDRSLSEQQAKTLVHWIEAGAPRGAGDDPLTQVKLSDSEEWELGPPDAIVEIPEFTVPATGVVEYQCPEVKNPIGRDVWLRGLEVHVGNKSVVHHIIVNNPSDARGEERTTGRGGEGRVYCNAPGNLGGYAPGLQPGIVFPKDTGVFFPKESNFIFQMHYTANGKAGTDRSRVGLYFHKKPPKHPLHMLSMGDPRFVIPAGAKRHTVTNKSPPTKQTMIVYDMMPHAHLRGRAARLTVKYPDGREEILLNVPRYDFNWQTDYIPVKPLTIPKGSVLEWSMTWDNSAQNPHNPDPAKPVRWGDQTWEEMGLIFMRYRWLNEAAAPVERKAATESSTQRTAAR